MLYKIFIFLLSVGISAKAGSYDFAMRSERLEPIVNSADQDNLATLGTIDKSLLGEALVKAAAQDRPNAVRNLLDAGADIEADDQIGDNALLVAANYGYEDVVDVLLEYNADVSAINALGDNALMLASFKGHLPVVNLLIFSDIDVDAQNGRGETALMLASLNNKVNVVRTLIEAGANVNLENRQGQTALSIALENHNNEIADEIRQQLEECPICLEKIEEEAYTTECPPRGHKFHKSCLLGSLKAAKVCPMCRRPLSLERFITSNNTLVKKSNILRTAKNSKKKNTKLAKHMRTHSKLTKKNIKKSKITRS